MRSTHYLEDNLEEPQDFLQCPDIFKQSDFDVLNSATLEQIKASFNQDDLGECRPSIMTRLNFFGFSFLRHRLLEPTQLRLVQRNGIPELVTYSGVPERREKVWSFWKPWTWFRAFRDDSSTVSVTSFSQLERQGSIGYGDRHLVYVKQGHFARTMVDGVAKFLGPGVHVIKSNNFSFHDQVKESEPYVGFENCHYLQVPSGKLAAVLIDNKPRLLGEGTHYLRSNNFKVLKNERELFYNCTDPVIKCGSLLRLMPASGEVAVYSVGSEVQTYPLVGVEAAKQEPVIIDNRNARFIRSLPTNLVNCNYPRPEDMAKYYEYYTKDSVNVGVKLFVAYKITNPTLALQKLDPGMIDEHIKHLTHVDMSAAGQETSLQQIQSTDMGHIEETGEAAVDSNAPSAPQFIRTWQDEVKRRLKDHLQEYGIELVRLNIEELKILDPEVEKKLAELPYEVAEANAKLASLEMRQMIARTEATQKSEVQNIEVDQACRQVRQEAEAKVDAAKLEKEAVLIKANGETEALEARAKIETQALAEKAKVLRENPDLVKIELAKLFAGAFKQTDKVVSPETMQSLFNQNIFRQLVPGAAVAEETPAPSLAAVVGQ